VTIAEATWILEHQIGPNVYGLKWVAVLRLVDHLKGRRRGPVKTHTDPEAHTKRTQKRTPAAGRGGPQ
jgi:hypothetical protein